MAHAKLYNDLERYSEYLTKQKKTYVTITLLCVGQLLDNEMSLAAEGKRSSTQLAAMAQVSVSVLKLCDHQIHEMDSLIQYSIL